MERHSIEKKRAKRKAQQKRKRLAHKQAKLVCHSGSSETSTSHYSSSSSMLNSPDRASSYDETILSLSSAETHTVHKDSPNTDSGSTSSTISSTLSSHVHSGDRAMLSSIDDIIFESDAYWDEKIKEELREFESYRDVHPSILTDAARTVKVFVDGTGPYKGTAGLKRVALEDYISRLHKRDKKAVQLCRLLRDHIKVLEDTIKDSKVKIMKLHRENKRKVEQVRYFWQNKIF